jgi:xylulose-5-phosphate/fructose-6-phosphate phosphoketolase
MRAIDEIRASSSTRAPRTTVTAPALADDRPDSPKGWTGPKEVDGKQVEGTSARTRCRSSMDKHPEHLVQLESGCAATAPRSCSTTPALIPELQASRRRGERRMGANPHANGGLLLRDLRMPDFRDYAVARAGARRRRRGEDTHVLGRSCATCAKLNGRAQLPCLRSRRNASNRLEAVFEVTAAAGTPSPGQRRVSRADGRVMEMLSEHHVRGLARGLPAHRPSRLFQLLRGLHPHRRLDVQPARQVAQGLQPAALAAADRLAQLPARLARVAQDHNGFTHQDPGFIDHVVNKKAEVVRVYLPPDANCLLSVLWITACAAATTSTSSWPKHPRPQWLTWTPRRRTAPGHRHLGVGQQRSGGEPDVVMACCGDVPTLETLAAVSILREQLPELASASSTSSTS